ncbi:MAG: ubiB [Planctomycetaceae bacterium]|nr:ubiB [Planctomycetaceae bacterium]
MLERRPFRFLRSLGRSRQIATVLLNYGFGDVVERLGLMRYIRWGKRLLFRRRGDQETRLTRPQRIRMALEDLGASFIKFGQVMSTRPDLVPADVIAELAKLQEGVPPFDSKTAIEILEEELGGSVSELYAEFDPQPLAAGSLGQVHRAKHFDGTQLAVKIRRPHVVRDVERDLELMLELAGMVERHIPEAEIFDPVGLVQQFSRSIRREMNFLREARTVEEFSRLFSHDATLVVPRIYPDLTSDAVITMEFIDGLRVTDHEGLLAAGLSPKAIAANGARIFFKQAFELGVFHGDPHPGNLRITRNGTLGLIDYGMVGRLEEERREQLVDLFLCISQRNVKGAVDLVLVVGKPSQEVDRGLLQSDVRDFIESYYGVDLDRLRMGKVLSDFVAILSNHGIRYPADLMLLIRATITLEGVGRDLDPEFNLAQHLAPFIKHVVAERYNPKRLAQRWKYEAESLLHALHDVPLHIERTLKKLSQDELKIQFEHRNLDYLVTELDRSGNRIVVGLVMSSLIVASALIVRSGTVSGINSTWITIPVFILSSLLGVWLIYGIFRSGRL